MRIAGGTVRRNYLARYEKNFSDKYESERKIESFHKFQRGSENPIDAAQALRIRRSISEVETYQQNLKSANTIYTNAESSLSTISTVIQSVYEKLVEGAHGTRNPDDMNIIAMEIDNYAEEMVQSMNIDIANRKVFGGTNNETVAFKIESSASGDKFVTYNGVSVNSSDDPYDFPSSERSYLDIGIGMQTNKATGRIDDQTAFPITFNGVECTGCGVTQGTVRLDLSTIPAAIDPNVPNVSLTVHAGGMSVPVKFAGKASDKDNVTAINDALKEAFQRTPQIDENGDISYVKDASGASVAPVANEYKNALDDEGNIDFDSLEKGSYYTINVDIGGSVKTIEFQAPNDEDVPPAPDGTPYSGEKPEINTTLSRIQKALDRYIGENVAKVYTKQGEPSKGEIHLGNSAGMKCDLSYPAVNNVPLDADGKLMLDGLTEGETYTFNLNGTRVSFVAGSDLESTVKNVNEGFRSPTAFGESEVPYITDAGVFRYDADSSSIQVTENAKVPTLEFSNVSGYSKNIMQLVLDAGKALRDGDHQLVARYADLIYKAQGTLSVAIADLGTHSKFIEFNEDRLADTMINLYTRQNDLESTDLPEEITNYKVLESVYNATLQMGANMLQQSIFDYIH